MVKRRWVPVPGMLVEVAFSRDEWDRYSCQELIGYKASDFDLDTHRGKVHSINVFEGQRFLIVQRSEVCKIRKRHHMTQHNFLVFIMPEFMWVHAAWFVPL